MTTPFTVTYITSTILSYLITDKRDLANYMLINRTSAESLIRYSSGDRINLRHLSEKFAKGIIYSCLHKVNQSAIYFFRQISTPHMLREYVVSRRDRSFMRTCIVDELAVNLLTHDITSDPYRKSKGVLLEIRRLLGNMRVKVMEYYIITTVCHTDLVNLYFDEVFNDPDSETRRLYISLLRNDIDSLKQISQDTFTTDFDSDWIIPLYRMKVIDIETAEYLFLYDWRQSDMEAALQFIFKNHEDLVVFAMLVRAFKIPAQTQYHVIVDKPPYLVLSYPVCICMTTDGKVAYHECDHEDSKCISLPVECEIENILNRG